MRTLAFSIAGLSLLASSAGANEVPTPLALDNPAYTEPARPWTSIEDPKSKAVIIEEPSRLRELRGNYCRDRITHARELAGLPPLLDREPASPDKPHLIYAVDRRQDGCSVMVMKGNPDDIRPLPEPAEGPPFQRIPADQ